MSESQSACPKASRKHGDIFQVVHRGATNAGLDHKGQLVLLAIRESPNQPFERPFSAPAIVRCRSGAIDTKCYMRETVARLIQRAAELSKVPAIGDEGHLHTVRCASLKRFLELRMQRGLAAREAYFSNAGNLTAV